ncbi:two-component system, chemotaxis family, sensor histidine kinase and response regulator WspE [Thermoflexales bacterium]|nr:two-component system, chemotaxis family, sensor histidine kinase and response regulator WspE [Thermoflexales bacterium]
MTLSEEVRAKLLASFRAELAEHIQTITDGLLALEQQTVAEDQRQPLLEDIFRAAHSLKGASRAIGLTSIEQLAHALEDVLNGLQKNTLSFSSALFTACYETLDAIRLVQAMFESGSSTPPAQALQALSTLATFKPGAPPAEARTTLAADRPAPVGGTPALGGTSSPIEPAREAGTPGAAADLPFSGDETIRINARRLDDLMTDLGELLVSKINAEQRQLQFLRAQELTANRRKSRASVRQAYNRLAHYGHARDGSEAVRHTVKDIQRVMKYLEEDWQRWHELDTLLSTVARTSADDLLHMSLTIDGLEQSIKRARLLPLSTITGPFGRMIRDLAQASGKEAVLQMVGTEIELDKHLLERVKDPLIHLLRNAVDHGIETPAERSAHGKPASGTVTLKATPLDRAVVIQVSDDGAGLNLSAIREAARRHSRTSAAASQAVEQLDEAELADLIFTPGLSTHAIVTSTSGRGVGLDVVRRNIEALNGRIAVEWAVGRGTTFTLTVPLALVSSRGLLVRASAETFTIPLGAIEGVQRITAQQIISVGGRDALAWQGRTLLLVHLADVLNLPRAQALTTQQHLPVVIIAAAERRLALVVDELVGEQEIVSRGLGKQLVRVGGIMGASVTASGEALLILNAADLIKLATGVGPRSLVDSSSADSPVEPAPRHHILIVDDSITTRSLEKNILEAAGYDVQLAVDGLEALSLLANGLPDLVISDVSMPRLDGLGLAQRIKSNERTRHLPVILVTSLDSPEDKARGIEVGADAYIVKSGFDQNNLLETIKQLI